MLTNLKEKMDYSLNFLSRFFNPIFLDANLKFAAKICSKSFCFLDLKITINDKKNSNIS